MEFTRRGFAMSAAATAAAAAAHGQARIQTPPNACDCHVHIIGPMDRYPMDPKRVYTPPEASVADLRALRQRTGISRHVLVQPSFYGVDNRCMVAALGELGGTARGVAVVPDQIAPGALRQMETQGVRGVRLNLETGGDRDPAAAAARLHALGDKLAAVNWHIQIYTALEVIVALEEAIKASPVPIVIDHFGLAMADKGTEQPGFETLVRLAGMKKIYVKLSAPHRISTLEPNYVDVAPLARQLIAAAPDRMLWGSDWPHTVRTPGKGPLDLHPFRVVDDVHDLELLRQWAGERVFPQILVDNPSRLYRF